MSSNIDIIELREESKSAEAQSDLDFHHEAVLNAFGAKPAKQDSKFSQSAPNEPLRLQKNDSFQNVDKTEDSFLGGVVDGALTHPTRALKQLCGAISPVSARAESEVLPLSESHRIGEIVGSIVPYIGIGLITHNIANGILGQAEQSALRFVGEQASNGFIMGAAFTPGENSSPESLLASRMRQGLNSSATFAAMAGTSASLGKYFTEMSTEAGLLANFGKRAGIGMISGTVGGIADAELRSGFQADRSQITSSAFGFAAFGAMAEAGTVMAKPLLAETLKPKLVMSPSRATDLLAADANTTIISNPGGWYDNLQRAIYKAPPEHTIIVTQERWFEEASRIAKSAKRPDIKLVFDRPELPNDTNRNAGASATSVGKKLSENATLEQTTKPPIPAIPKELSTAAPGARNTNIEAPETNKPSVWEIRSRLIENLRNETKQFGEDPLEALTAALKRGRAVMVGEYHVNDSINRALGAKLMPQLKEAGLTHLAIEHSSDFAGKIFDADAKLDIESLAPLLQHNEFYDLLNAARKAGIEIVPVDSPLDSPRDLASRNIHMDQKIADILDNSENKVLYWVGNRHLQMLDSTGEGPQVAKLLRDRGVSLTTFYGQHDNFWREEPVRNLFTPPKPVAVPVAKAPTLSGLSWLHDDNANHALSKFSEFDYVLMYPHQTPSHYD